MDDGGEIGVGCGISGSNDGSAAGMDVGQRTAGGEVGYVVGGKDTSGTADDRLVSLSSAKLKDTTVHVMSLSSWARCCRRHCNLPRSCIMATVSFAFGIAKLSILNAFDQL